MHKNTDLTIDRAEFNRDPSRYFELALTQTLTITKNGRAQTILIPVEEYVRLKRRDRKVIAVEELSQRQIEAIRDARAPSEYAYLDEELRDRKP